MNSKEAIRRIDREIARLQKMRDILEQVELENINSVDENKIRLEFTTLDEVVEARNQMRDFCNAKYSIRTIFSSFGRMYATWGSEEIPIDIWLGTHLEDFPKSLLKEGCRIEKSERIETDYNVVCSMD